MFKTSFLNDKKLPLVIEPEEMTANNSVFEFLESLTIENREFFHERLLEHGALLFRGFATKTAKRFERFIELFAQRKTLDYAGGVSPRVELTGGVYTSTEYPPPLALALHNEMSYSDKFPNQIYFCCLTAPEYGGATTIGDSRRILNEIDAEIVEIFKRKQIRYDRNLHAAKNSGYSWQDAFETEDKRAVEKRCREIGASFEWRNDDYLRLWQIRPATAVHPLTGAEVWFNQADGFHPSNLDAETYRQFIAAMPETDFRLNARFGDGSPINVAHLEHIRAVMRRETVPVNWQTGDVLVLDNLLAAHGREPFSGARKIVVAMT